MADVYLMGDESTSHGDPVSGDLLILSKFTCATSGTVNTLGVYYRTDTGAGEHIKACLYADSAGAPGAFIIASAEAHGAAGWNYLAVTPTAVTSGTVYWIGWNELGYRLCRHSTTGVTRYKALTYGNAWPDPAGTGFTSVTDWVTQAVAYGTAAATGCPRQSMYLVCTRNE